MGLTKIRLGDYIERSTVNNSDLKYGIDFIAGVNNQGIFTAPKGNTEGVDLKPYKIVNNGAFVYNPTRLDLGSIAYRMEDLCIVSHLYMVFYLTEEGKKIIDPLWLFIYFRRSEFCREVTFRNFGSQRPEFNFSDMSDIIIHLPDIDIQRKFVAVYNAMLENQQSYERRLDDLKLVCDAYIEDLRRKMPCEAIGAYIEEFNQKNEIGLTLDSVRGIATSIQWLLRLLGLQREQRPAATGHARPGGGGDEIAAVGADVEVQFFHISSFLVVGVQRSGEQGLQPDAQKP